MLFLFINLESINPLNDYFVNERLGGASTAGSLTFHSIFALKGWIFSFFFLELFALLLKKLHKALIAFQE